jgi:hypothetical protein
MPQETTTIAIPVALRDRIAACADLEQKTQDRLADEALRRQLALALAARGGGESLAARYLTDPRIATAGASSPTVHVSKAASAGAADLAAAMGDELGRNVPKGRAIQALLWAELEPLPLEAERVPLPEPPALDTFTMNVPGSLNAALLDLALRRATSREAVVDDLLTCGLDELGSDTDLLDELRGDKRVQPSDGRGKVTIRVPRKYDRRLSQAGGDAFGGIKAHALQTLLWRGLDGAKDEPPTELPDRRVMLNGALFARVSRHLVESREERGRVVPMKEFVETAVEKELAREQRRRGQTKEQ